MKNVQRFFQVARAVAETSRHPHFRVGSAVILNKGVLSTGENKPMSHPLQKRYNNLRFGDVACDHTIHAELNALIKAKNLVHNLKDAKIFVYRITRKGKRAISRPCAACMQAIKDFGIREVYYTTEMGYAHETIYPN